ncbi:MAG: hypothetical protein JSW01_02225 [Candidatus Bathyarchaeota archaeon]|nr:MAG: hypothetical protein JSW01_02225 [Candidatus Bathyarchaeota archaeon]
MLILLISLVIVSTCKSLSTSKAKSLNHFSSDSTDYYFGSDSTSPLSPDNRIVVNIDNEGDAAILMRLHVKAKYPNGVGDLIEIPVPYPQNRVVVRKISISNSAEPNYRVIRTGKQVTIQVRVEKSPREVYLEVFYLVKDVYDGRGLDIKFLLSSYATEISMSLMMSGRKTWINHYSIELNPQPSRETYFLISEEVLPFSVYIVLSNVNPKIIEYSLETRAAPYSLEVIPYYAMIVSMIPAFLSLLIVKTTKILGSHRRVGMIVLAYRNLHRRLTRFVLTILGVSIPTTLLVQTLIQNTFAQKMIRPEVSEGVWYITLIFIISVVIGGFQVYNTVFSSVMERMRELGIMKAIGFNPSYITQMVMAESALIGLMAGFLGSIIATVLTIVSIQIFYGITLPHSVFVETVVNIFGDISFSNPFLRNYAIALVIMTAMGMILAYFWPSEYNIGGVTFMVVSPTLFFILLRPADPFTIDRLIEIAPTLVVNLIIGTLFAVILCISAGSYVAYKAGKTRPSEAMRSI